MVINPCNLEIDLKHKDYLFNLFYGAGERCGWTKDHGYYCKKITIHLTHSIIKTKRKNNGFRYHVIDNAILGKGSYGLVSPIALTYKIEANQLISKYHPAGKRLVVKRIRANRNNAPYIDKKTEKLVSDEYFLSSLCAHLSPKLPVLYSKYFFTIFRRIEGNNLSKCLKNDKIGLAVLTTEQRFQLSMNLLLAVQKQVTDLNLVHRDLKPQNIMVSADLSSVNVIDFGLAKLGEYKAIQDSVGTPAYASPEAYRGSGTTKLSDVYSVGLIIKEIWANGDHLRPATERIIEHIIKGMTATRPQARLTLVDASEQFQIAHELEFPPPINQNPPPSMESKSNEKTKSPNERKTKKKNLGSFFFGKKKKEPAFDKELALQQEEGKTH